MTHSFRYTISNSRTPPEIGLELTCYIKGVKHRLFSLIGVSPTFEEKRDTYNASRHWAVKQGYNGVKDEDFNTIPEVQLS